MLRATFSREVAALGLQAGSGPGAPVTDADLASLPEPAQRYLRFMGVVGRPRDLSFRVGMVGRFRFGPQKPWLPCEVWQFNARPEIARIFYMRLKFGGLVPAIGRDTYRAGKGRMHARLFDLFTVVDETGEKLDIGELVTWLNDAVLFAPSMLLGPGVTFAAVDASSFELALSDGGQTVRARVLLDERGAPKDFETTDRFAADLEDPKGPMVRCRWTTPVTEWQQVEGRPVPLRARALWHPQQGPFDYADFGLVPGGLAFNVRPGE